MTEELLMLRCDHSRQTQESQLQIVTRGTGHDAMHAACWETVRDGANALEKQEC